VKGRIKGPVQMKTTVVVQEVTTKKVAIKLRANCCSSGDHLCLCSPDLLVAPPQEPHPALELRTSIPPELKSWIRA